MGHRFSGNDRKPRAILAISSVSAAWLLMQIIHESGHVIGALLSGGSVKRVVLVPWEFSRTDFSSNPAPLFACWAGSILGVVIPLFLWGIAQSIARPTAFWFRFFAGFCGIANGAYIAMGVLTGDGDGGDLLRHGSPTWVPIVFGVCSTTAGLAIWYKLGSNFGFGPHAQPVNWVKAIVATSAFAVILFAEVITALI